MKRFQIELKEIIKKVYENEELFIKRFGVCYKNIDSIDSFYMAGYECIATFVYKDEINTGVRMVDKKRIIDTESFLDWAEGV